MLAAGTPEALLEAASLWRGQILADVTPPDPSFEDWLSIERLQRQEQISRSLKSAIAAAERFSSDADIVALAEGLLRIDRSEEAAFRALIAVDLKRGEHDKALKRYGECCEVLLAIWTAKPSAVLRAMMTPMPEKVAGPRAGPPEGALPAAPRRSVGVPSVLMTMRPPVGPPERVRDLTLVVEDEFAISLGKLRSVAVLLPRSFGGYEDANYELITSVRCEGDGVQVTFRLISRTSDRLLLTDRAELDQRRLGQIGREIARMAFEVELAIGRDRMADQAASASGSEGRAPDPGFARPVASLASIQLSLPMIEGAASLAPNVFDEALVLAKKAVNIDPWDPKCRIILAWAYMRKSMYAQGTREFEKALTLTRGDPGVLAAAAEGLSYLGETMRAIGYGERAGAPPGRARLLSSLPGGFPHPAEDIPPETWHAAREAHAACRKWCRGRTAVSATSVIVPLVNVLIGGSLTDSNGVAAGRTLQEAETSAVLELVERDAVAIWWYGKVLRPAVAIEVLDECGAAMLRMWLQTRDRSTWLLDLTHDLHMPVIAAVSCGPDGHDIAYGFAARLSVSDAALAASLEMLQTELSLKLARSAAIKGKPGGHGARLLSWSNKTNISEIPFLAPHEDAVAVPTASSACGPIPEIAARIGREVVFVDLQRPDDGLFVVRALAPGLRPWWPRFAPGRLGTVPGRLGWKATAIDEEAVGDDIILI
jgi:ribosomal protein S12 methylthiotransferase accessory factor